IAQWLRDRCQDFDAAERAARRAVEHTPTRLETLELYASLQRRAPGPALVDTLLRIDRLVVDSLDVLHEAALVAGERVILEQLYRKAAGMWLRGENAAGAQQPNEVAPWALDRLVEHYVAANDVPRAVRTLLEGTRLPFEDDTIVELQRRAAELSAASGNKRRAIDVYRGLLDERPSDLEAMRRAAELCEQEGHLSEALALHMRELDLVDDPDRRLELRLQFSRLASALEKQGGRAAWLRANLDERPGHEPSIEELVSTLEARGKHDELADELGEQARMLELKQQPARAAQLWTRVAALAEEPLGDGERAIAAHTRVVELACTNDTLDALARLHLSRQEPAKAAAWLERRLEAAAAGDRVAVLLKLAHARIQADRRDGAVAALSLAFEEAPRNAEVRKLLLGLHRQNKDWASLADTLTRAALCIGDERTIVSYAREAAAIYVRTLGVPDAAVPVLRRAVELEPDDAELRGMLAEGLRVAGDLDEARRLLEGLVKDFGRRRLPERAYVHLQLARVAKAQGRTDEALDELETAARMDAGSVTVLKELAELARQTGHLERAERAYRTLLVTVRREPNPETLLVGPTEVLLELSRIASDRQDDVKASELSESALESLVAHDFEAERIQNKLRARKDWTLCERVLRRRLVHVTTTHKRARVHADLGDLLMVLGRKEEAFDERIAAVRTDPGSPLHHEAARDLALALGRLDAYVSAVEALLSDERADTSAHVRCELFLRLGEVLEKERRDFTRAQSLYAHAADTGVRRVDVWRAQARLAEALGDSEEYARFSGLLAEVGEDRVESGTDALYRRAEVQLASSETLEEGVTSLREALDDAFRGELAAMILLRATDQHPEHVGLLELYEQVARRGGDDHVLLHYLERRAMHPSATPEQAREAVDKALELGDLDRAETLMSRAAEMGRSLNRADDLRRVEWALLGLAERRLAAGDLAGAVKWLSEAAEVASLDVLFAITQRVAERAGRPGGDLTLAAKPYERLLERAPSDERAWRPLAEIYARLGEVDQLERIVEETCDGLEDASDRSALRLSLARALLEKSQRADDAVEHLKRVLIDEPQHAEAHALLTSHLERAGRSGELSDLLRQQLRAAEERRDEAAVRIASLDLARRLDESEREEALTMLRSALRWVPEDPEILEALYTRLGPQDDARERAQIAEALLRVAAPETAGDRALELVAMYDALEDQEGALRALALGTQRAPGDKRLRELLLERYRARGDFLGLAETLIAEAQSTEEPQRRAALFIAAARVRRDELGDPAGAAPLLAQAFELAPSDQELCIELARTQSSAGSNDEALATLGAALQKNTKPEDRLALFRARAGLARDAGQLHLALVDLEQAFAIAPAAVASELEHVLSELIDEAVRRADDKSQQQLA
ncbi:MAG TPA: tetratricopeptide repeat protein, partial [Polyangiaceae bacterium]|nr:tetratricopeptide repeat protein [Polyangiaceae bacterium]